MFSLIADDGDHLKIPENHFLHRNNRRNGSLGSDLGSDQNSPTCSNMSLLSPYVSLLSRLSATAATTSHARNIISMAYLDARWYNRSHICDPVKNRQHFTIYVYLLSFFLSTSGGGVENITGKPYSQPQNGRADASRRSESSSGENPSTSRRLILLYPVFHLLSYLPTAAASTISPANLVPNLEMAVRMHPASQNRHPAKIRRHLADLSSFSLSFTPFPIYWRRRRRQFDRETLSPCPKLPCGLIPLVRIAILRRSVNISPPFRRFIKFSYVSPPLRARRRHRSHDYVPFPSRCMFS